MQENILKKIASEAKLIADSNPSYPMTQHVYLSRDKAIALAEQLNANKYVAEIGTYLMDCEIGKAITEGRIKDHVQLSLQKTKNLLDKFPTLDSAIRANIEHCVLEHHGGVDFYTIESEICCNADCYRFASSQGVALALRYFRDYEFEELIKLLGSKLEEKHNALTLSICKQELDPQYKLLSDFFRLALLR